MCVTLQSQLLEAMYSSINIALYIEKIKPIHFPEMSIVKASEL